MAPSTSLLVRIREPGARRSAAEIAFLLRDRAAFVAMCFFAVGFVLSVWLAQRANTSRWPSFGGVTSALPSVGNTVSTTAPVTGDIASAAAPGGQAGSCDAAGQGCPSRQPAGRGSRGSRDPCRSSGRPEGRGADNPSRCSPSCNRSPPRSCNTSSHRSCNTSAPVTNLVAPVVRAGRPPHQPRRPGRSAAITPVTNLVAPVVQPVIAPVTDLA